MLSGRAAFRSRRLTALLLAAWLAGCAAMAPAPTPPANGTLPPVLQRVAVAVAPGVPDVRIDGLDKSEGALQGAADGAALLFQGGSCGDPMSCAFVLLILGPAFVVTGTVIGTIEGERGADEAAARIQALVTEGQLGQRLAQRTAEQLVSDGIPATLLVVPPREERPPVDHDALVTIAVDQISSIDTRLESSRAIAIHVSVATRLATEPGTVRRSTHRVDTERHRMGEWLADGGRPLTAAMDGAITQLAESIVDELATTAWIEPLARLRDGHPDSGSVMSLFIGLRPIDPGVSMMGVSGSLPGEFFEWKTVGSLQPTLRWESFPEAADAVSYELRIARATADGLGPGEEVYRRRDLPTNEHRLEIPLLPSTKYFWSVRARFVREGRSFATVWGSLGSSPLPLSRSSYRFRTPSG